MRRESDVGDPTVEVLTPGERLAAIYDHTIGWPLIEPLGLRAAHFMWMARLAAGVEVVRLRCDRHRRSLAEVADAVEALAA